MGCYVTQDGLRRSSIEEEIKQLENKKKRLIQEQKEQERKDRTNRLCKRMGFIEKLLPDTIPLKATGYFAKILSGGRENS